MSSIGRLTASPNNLLGARPRQAPPEHQDLAVASYTAVCKLVHTAKATVAAALRTLEDLGLIARIKRRVRMSWHQGGSRSVQVTSCYRLRAPEPTAESEAARPGPGTTGTAHSEFGGRTVNRGIEVFYQEKVGKRTRRLPARHSPRYESDGGHCWTP